MSNAIPNFVCRHGFDMNLRMEAFTHDGVTVTRFSQPLCDKCMQEVAEEAMRIAGVLAISRPRR